MAQVAHSTELQPNLGYHLSYQFQAWKSIPEYVEWWPEMDGTQREVFHLEWVGITESRLTALQQWAERGLLTDSQRAQYEGLLECIARYRPLLDRLLQD
ncbi:MAG: hypothetical protein M3Y58_10645 [Chloroflexota bacterium]|nr:hypothetical protein [Chloroflexota bacterium]